MHTMDVKWNEISNVYASSGSSFLLKQALVLLTSPAMLGCRSHFYTTRDTTNVNSLTFNLCGLAAELSKPHTSYGLPIQILDSS